MYKQLIMPTEISIKDKKNIVKGHVNRAAIFARTKVFEVITAENESFYLIYYKNSLVYGDKLSKVEAGSFIDTAFHEGIVIEAPHPILTALIPNHSVSIPNKNKLFSQLQIHYPLDEMAYIATTLDAFFEKYELIKIIDRVYFDYRRNGSFIKAFQVIRMLNDFAPDFKSAKERFNSQEYNSYHDFYQSSSLASILKKDPLFVEHHCFQNRTHPEKRIFLENILRKQTCLAELLLLWLEKVQNTEPLDKYTDLALKFVTMKEWIFILGQMKINPYRQLPEAKPVIEKMVQEGKYETSALYLLQFIHDLPASYDPILTKVWENLSAGFVVSQLDDFLFMFQQPVHEEHTSQSEQKLFQLTVILLKEHDLKTVIEKLYPIQKLLPQSLVIQKVNKMLEMAEDPDRMMELGDYYAEFRQYDKAIDCYSWEMELQPQNPIPVKKISKMYQQKGMAEEAATYQKVYDQLKSNQRTG
ncbi:hypothetical protein RCG23_00045 [Neobacillus sp. PS3-34]|uniref:tetratricopeptide repeat protein n=1 Tax=Neobacillus sp. PS3-34 TaxID=3070678 RepID=UPI0027DF17C9|nr:hypothetical protein [Neobacillus sp. PS3-34]WML48586.1 hypothetical protein RCG23_00045 [Neobacillus sp. PS3-34]